jgi:1-acyl-sn-glycerol-3-phosphate acyltransferase
MPRLIKKRKSLYSTSVFAPVLRYLCIFFMKITGWKIEGEIPPQQTGIIIAAPHKNNWDVAIMLAVVMINRRSMYWLAKDTLFVSFFGRILTWLGGIPVDRSKNNGMVEKAVEFLMKNEGAVIAIAPEGTRVRQGRIPWKTGFVQIATRYKEETGNDITIGLAFIDYKRKAAGILDTIKLTGELEVDMVFVRSYYFGIE